MRLHKHWLFVISWALNVDQPATVEQPAGKMLWAPKQRIDLVRTHTSRYRLGPTRLPLLFVHPGAEEGSVSWLSTRSEHCKSRTDGYRQLSLFCYLASS